MSKSSQYAALARSNEATEVTTGSQEPQGQCYSGRFSHKTSSKKGKGSPYSITERRVLELIPVLGSQPASNVNHKPSGRLPLLSARPVVTLATIKRAATNFAVW